MLGMSPMPKLSGGALRRDSNQMIFLGATVS